MHFNEEDLKSYALPLGENAKEQCLEVLGEILQTLNSMGWKVIKTHCWENLFKYKTKLVHEQYGSMMLLPLGAYGNDTRGDKREPLEIGLITEKPLQDLGHQLAFRLMGGYSEGESGVGSIFMDIGPSKATIIRIGYSIDKSVAFYYNRQKLIVSPEEEMRQGEEKHKASNYSYKRMVRVIKKLHCLMCNADSAVAKVVEPYILERLLLALDVQELIHFETISDKLKYCSLKIGTMLEQDPGYIQGLKGIAEIVQEKKDEYQRFFVELLKFCEIEC